MQTYDQYETLKTTRKGRILTVSFNRPDALNATDAKLHYEFSRLVRDLRQDKDADVIVLTGEGRAFSAGGDINWMQEGVDDPASFEVTAHEARDIVYGLLDIDKPVIARVNGHAIGLGATIMLCCDIIIASEKAKIGDPHVLMGLVAGDGGAVLWPQMIGYAKAKYYLMTGDIISATEAERIGLITKVVAEDKLDEEVDAVAQKLANGPLKAINYTKIATNLQLKAVVSASFEAGLALEIASNTSKDHAEAVDAFRNKRTPKFTGR